MSPICTRREFLRTLGAVAALVSLRGARAAIQPHSGKRHVGENRPHWPVDRGFDRYFGLISDKWKMSPRDPETQPWSKEKGKELMDLKMAVYAAQIERMDYGAGRVLDKIRELDAEENTLVMFFAAHGGPSELYDLEADRTELNNLAAGHPEKVNEIKALYGGWATRCGVQPWPIKKPKR